MSGCKVRNRKENIPFIPSSNQQRDTICHGFMSILVIYEKCMVPDFSLPGNGALYVIFTSWQKGDINKDVGNFTFGENWILVPLLP